MWKSTLDLYHEQLYEETVNLLLVYSRNSISAAYCTCASLWCRKRIDRLNQWEMSFSTISTGLEMEQRTCHWVTISILSALMVFSATAATGLAMSFCFNISVACNKAAPKTQKRKMETCCASINGAENGGAPTGHRLQDLTFGGAK